MIPLFKSHFSIGKSILVLKSKGDEKASDGIFDMAKEANMENVVLVEDNMTSFLEAAKVSKEFEIRLIYGLRLTVCDTHSEESLGKDCHKVIIFAKNGEGCKRLNKIYSRAYSTEYNCLTMNELKNLWTNDVKLVIPFYDSFIYNNIMEFSSCIPRFDFTTPTFFIEDNELPFDQIIKEGVNKYTEKHGHPIERAKTIYYKNREDFLAYQTFKCAANRSGWAGKSVSLQKPNLEHCGSSEFSFESYLANK